MRKIIIISSVFSVLILLIIYYLHKTSSTYRKLDKDGFEFMINQIEAHRNDTLHLNGIRDEKFYYCPDSGFVNDKETAIAIAKIILPKIYGKGLLLRSYQTYLYKNEIWFVRTNHSSLKGYLRGDGDLFVLIDKKTGKIIGVFGTKD